VKKAHRSLRWHAAVLLALPASGLLGVAARAQSANEYIDSAVCARCHADIARTFHETGMGRSFYRLRPEKVIEDFQSGKPFYHEASDSYFTMLERGGRYYQRRWQIAFDGKETNVEEKQIDFVLGSGNHARTYLHLTPRNTLQQLPLGWYAEKGGYFAMNPGYDRADHHGSTRPIHYECMFCHNGYPRIAAAHEEAGAEPQYRMPLPEGIDCQRCHGPGQGHVETAARPGARLEEIRAAVVNPARLSPAREMEVCLQCHLETTSRPLPHAIVRFDRAPFSYVPGQPLGDFRLDFDRTPGKNTDFEIAGAGYRLRESQCFLKSGDRLRCTTCHNPHEIPRGEAAMSHYNAVCRTCHTTIATAPAVHRSDANCVACHMPKRRTDDAVHVVMTDHKITRRPPPGDLLAEKEERRDSPATSYRGEVVPYYPERPAVTAENQLYTALAQIVDRSNLEAGLSRLSDLIAKYRPRQAGFYAALGEGYLAAEDKLKAIQYLEEAAQRAPASESVQLELGNVLLESEQWTKAEDAFRRAKTMRPDDAEAWGFLGWALWQQGKEAEAKSALEAAVKLDPESTGNRNHLGAFYMGSGDVTSAERQFRAGVAIDPGVAEWQSNLAGLLGSTGRFIEARYHFERSIHLDPSYAGARLNYARLLANLGQLDDSEKQAKAAVAAGINMAGAHELLGYILSAKGDLKGAVDELQTTLRLNPDSGRAHYELGVALAKAGNTSGALDQLRIAAQSPEPAVRSAAAEMLRSLSK
jgi:predicted CXXCH cytochrome family protein